MANVQKEAEKLLRKAKEEQETSNKTEKIKANTTRNTGKKAIDSIAPNIITEKQANKVVKKIKKDIKKDRLLSQIKKEQKRIKRFIRSAEARGYIFSENVMPSMPKRITEATLRKFKNVTPEKLWKKAAYYDQGKKISGSKRRAEERSEAAKKGAQTRKINRTMKVLKEVRKIIAEWTPNPAWSDDLAHMKEQDKNKLENMLNGAIAAEGEYAVAKRLEEKYDQVIELTYAIIYGDSPKRGTPQSGRDGVMQNLATFAAILHGKPLTIRESMEYTEYGETEEYEDELS